MADRDDADVVGGFDRRRRADRVGDDELLELRSRDALGGAARQHAMRNIGVDRARPGGEQRVGGVAKRAARIDDVVDEDAIVAGDVADDVHHFGFAGALAALVDDGERRVDTLGERPRAHHAAHIRRDDHDVLEFEVRLDVRNHHGRGEQIVGRDVEEALHLPRMEIDGEHAVGAGAGNEIADKFRGNRRARALFTILARVAEIGNDRCDAARRGATQRVGHDEQLHQMIVGGRRSGLDHESVLPADIFEDFDPDFLIGESSHLGAAERNPEMGRNRLRERPVRVARQKFHRRHGPISPRPRLRGVLPVMAARNNMTPSWRPIRRRRRAGAVAEIASRTGNALNVR